MHNPNDELMVLHMHAKRYVDSVKIWHIQKLHQYVDPKDLSEAIKAMKEDIDAAMELVDWTGDLLQLPYYDKSKEE